MRVRTAESRDEPQLLMLAHRFHQESPEHRERDFSADKLIDLMEATIVSKDWLVLVCEASPGEIVGVALFYRMETYYGHDREVGDLALYVVPEYRATGAGLLLMEQVIRWASKARAPIVAVVRTGIAHAACEGLYQALGFVPAGTVWTLAPRSLAD